MPDATPAIAVRDLRKVYDGKAAVDGLSLTVPRGSFFGFLSQHFSLLFQGYRINVQFLGSRGWTTRKS